MTTEEQQSVRNVTQILAMLALFWPLVLVPTESAMARPHHKVVIIDSMDIPILMEMTDSAIKTLNAWTADLNIIRLQGNANKTTIEKHLKKIISEGNTNLVMTSGTIASKIANIRLANTKIPLVFFGVSDPVGAGLVEKLHKPTSKRVTGVAFMVPQTSILAIADQLFPANQQRRFSIIRTDYLAATSTTAELIPLAKQLSKQFKFVEHVIAMEGYQPEESERLATMALEHARAVAPSVDGFWLVADPLSVNEDFVRALSKIKPIVHGLSRASVANGALFAFGADPAACGKDAARLSQKILQNKPISAMVVKECTDSRLSINLETAARLSIIVPSQLLQLAHQNIFPKDHR